MDLRHVDAGVRNDIKSHVQAFVTNPSQLDLQRTVACISVSVVIQSDVEQGLEVSALFLVAFQISRSKFTL